MLTLDYKESQVPKNWCFWTVVLEKTLESPLDCKEIQLVYPKGNQSWIFIGRTDAEVETPVLWPPDAKNWLTGKDPDAGKDWRRVEKGMRVSSGSWWWTGRPAVLQSVGSQSQTRLSDWTPCLSYGEQCFSEHWGAGTLSYHVFLWIYAQKWDFWVTW